MADKQTKAAPSGALKYTGKPGDPRLAGLPADHLTAAEVAAWADADLYAAALEHNYEPVDDEWVLKQRAKAAKAATRAATDEAGAPAETQEAG